MAVFLLRDCFAVLTGAPEVGRAVPAIVAAGAGVLLLAGLWTPITGSLSAIVELWIAFSRPGDPWPFLLAAAVAAALALLGPGAWSTDARIYGRKRIEIRDR